MRETAHKIKEEKSMIKRRAIAALLIASMCAGTLAGCGNSGQSGTTGEGKVINIYSWNDEFRQRVRSEERRVGKECRL